MIQVCPKMKDPGYLKNKICVEKLMIININQPYVFWILHIYTYFFSDKPNCADGYQDNFSRTPCP